MVKTATLTKADRCDRCGVQGIVMVLIPISDDVDWPLCFCKHHFDKHEAALPENSVIYADDRETLV